MTDTSETPSDTPAEETRTHNKKLIFAALAEAGVTKVSIEFDGAGDSGQIEEILAWNAAGDTIPLPSDRKLQLTSPAPGNPPVETTLQEAVETLAYDYLEDTHPGWEINDGAFGTFVFDVPARSITLEHNERYTEVHTSAHEF
jgi:Family of unknown function (DUF6878)